MPCTQTTSPDQRPNAIDFAVIDDEGGEESLLRTFYLKRFQPRILFVDDTPLGRDTTVRTFIESCGYTYVRNLEANDRYLHSGEPELVQNFRRWFY